MRLRETWVLIMHTRVAVRLRRDRVASRRQACTRNYVKTRESPVHLGMVGSKADGYVFTVFLGGENRLRLVVNLPYVTVLIGE